MDEEKHDKKKKILLLDTRCVQTVCGQRWLEQCMATMDPKVRKHIKSKPSRHVFRFCGGEKLDSIRTINIPLSIKGKNFHLETEDIPCLLRKGAMKEAKPIIDINKDIITFFNMISTGHYLMEVQDWKKKYDCEGNVENMALVDEWDRMDNNNNEWKVIPRLDNKGEVSREQVYPHIDNKTREQTSAADDTADMADSDVETGLELDYKGEVPRVQVAPHGNGKARGQRSAAVVTADTADGNHDPDLEPYVGPVDRRSAARPAGSDADRDTQDALPAAHQPVGQAVDDANGDSHANEDPETNNMEATNGSEAVLDAKYQSFSSNQECDLLGSISNISGSKSLSDWSDQSEKFQFDLEKTLLKAFI